VLNYVDDNRDQLKQTYPAFQKFKNEFVVDNSMISEFTGYGGKEGDQVNEKELNISLRLISLQIKALIARDLWSISEYYEIINSNDNEFLKAMEIISDRRPTSPYTSESAGKCRQVNEIFQHGK
jgi:carboxyl-terminal processing protease